MILLLQWCALITAMEPQKKEPQTRPQIVSKKRENESLYNAIPESFKKQRTPLVYYKARLEQADSFSCGYRTLFHADCLERALQRAVNQRNCIENHLEQFLKNEEHLKMITLYLQTDIEKNEPLRDLKKGTTYIQLLGFVKAYLPLLNGKILPIFLTRNNEITIKQSVTNIEIPLAHSAELQNHLRKVIPPLSACHFACFLPSATNHWILASIITDTNSYAKLHVMDSNNNALENAPNMAIIISKLLEYVEEVNKRNHFFTFANSVPRPLAQSAPVPQ